MRSEVLPSSEIDHKWMSIIYPNALKANKTIGEPEFDLTPLRQGLIFNYDNKTNDRQRYDRDMELITQACSLDHRIYLGDGKYSSLDDVDKIENNNLILLGAAIKMSLEEAEDREGRESHVAGGETEEVENEMLQAAIAESLAEGQIDVINNSGDVQGGDKPEEEDEEDEEKLLARALAMSLEPDEET
ncbi:hypothetical protein N431DRAFT_430929 [Stipitochalara longipes BDJ]|nr:hypothetical protein N431DRAFT_430929 [Stipitochalara longipes BDJ]